MDYRRMMGVEELSSKSKAGRGVRIAVLDSGIPHPDSGVKFRNSCHAIPMDEIDEFGHATAIASILFGGHGITGLCDNATPIFIKVLGNDGMGSIKSVSDGILKAIDSDIDLINLSLGFIRTEKCPKSLKNACQKAMEAGKTVICASGNDGGPVNWPAALESTLCVGSSSENGLKTAFSSYGEVDFVAPGVDLPVVGPNGHSFLACGTSFSAAIVTGVAALLVPIIRENLCLDAIKSALKSLAQDVDAPGWDERTGYGVIYGHERDTTVGMKEKGFFDRILCAVKKVFGYNKRSYDGRI